VVADVELLRIRGEGSRDARGRIRRCDGFTIAVGHDGAALWIGDAVSDDVAGELTAVFTNAPVPTDPRARPPALDACMRLVDGAELQMGPSYVISDDASFDSDVTIICSGADVESPRGASRDPVESLRGANPGNWVPVEWNELLDGRLGPYAIAVIDRRAVSICHTPGPMTDRAAEVGVWTDPEFRGRGYAAATAAAWVPLVRAPDRHLFYSTDAGNRSSQRVAERLGARELGWTWRAHRRRSAVLRVHPLCSLAHVDDRD
jgi:GNAT superfamily N-acetyltransferase